MKRIMFFLILASLTGCFQRRPSVTTGMEGKPLPPFNLLLMDSTTRLNTTNIPTGKPVVFFLFSPNCPYCRAQTQEIIDNMKSLTNIRFYLLSNFPFDAIKQYYDQYQLNKYPNIIVGQDYDVYFANYYKAAGVPYTAIFRKDKILQQVLIGQVDVSIIKDISFQ